MLLMVALCVTKNYHFVFQVFSKHAFSHLYTDFLKPLLHNVGSQAIENMFTYLQKKLGDRNPIFARLYGYHIT